MRTHLEFASTAFPAYPGEDQGSNPGRFGKRLAEFLCDHLSRHGFTVKGIGAEDWGWRVELEHAAFPLWVGCGNYEEFENGFLCFIEPSTLFVRRGFSKLGTTPTVEKLAAALETVLLESGQVSRLRWWSDHEANP